MPRPSEKRCARSRSRMRVTARWLGLRKSAGSKTPSANRSPCAQRTLFVPIILDHSTSKFFTAPGTEAGFYRSNCFAQPRRRAGAAGMTGGACHKEGVALVLPLWKSPRNRAMSGSPRPWTFPPVPVYCCTSAQSAAPSPPATIPVATSLPRPTLFAAHARASAAMPWTAVPCSPLLLPCKIICARYLLPMVPTAAPPASLISSLVLNPATPGFERRECPRRRVERLPTYGFGRFERACERLGRRERRRRGLAMINTSAGFDRRARRREFLERVRRRGFETRNLRNRAMSRKPFYASDFAGALRAGRS